MRWIAAFCTLIMLVALGLAGMELRAALSDPTPQAAPAQIARAVVEVGQDSPTQEVAVPWPMLFGEPMPPVAPKQPVAVEPTPQPSAPLSPPLSSLGYVLKGIVRSGDAVWGIVSHPSGDTILRVGGVLDNGMSVTRIDDAGLWVDTGRDAPELLGFADQR